MGEWQQESPLVLMGYRVGKTKGLPVFERQDILRKAFDDHIPNAFDPDYMATWGTPGTRQRYNKIVEHLTHQIELRQGRRNMRAAVADWEADLSWFRKTFGGRFR